MALYSRGKAKNIEDNFAVVVVPESWVGGKLTRAGSGLVFCPEEILSQGCMDGRHGCVLVFPVSRG